MQSHRKRRRYLTSTTPTTLTMSHFIPNNTSTTLNITNNHHSSSSNPNPNKINRSNNNNNHSNVISYNNNNNNNNVGLSATRHSGSSSSGSATTAQACAACKYQRRKCQPDCLLAPYFPYDCTRQFQNAHKLFGVSNITKIIRNLSQHEKDEAMKSIIIQSDIRAYDPVGGCYRIIKDLQRQIELYQAELNLVLQQLSICRAQAVQQHQQQQFHMDATASDSSLSCVDNINPDPLITYNPLQTSYNNCINNVGNNQEGYGLIQDDQNQLQDYSSWTVPEVVPGALLEISDDQYKNESLQNERSEDAILESHKVPSKEEDNAGQQVQDNDLKGAATLFTLTNTS